MKFCTSLTLLFASSQAAWAQTAGAWQQCGGNGYTGPTQCISGYYCFQQNAWYHQCIPGQAASTTLRTSTTSRPPPSTTTSTPPTTTTSTSGNPFSLGQAFVNPVYRQKLEETYNSLNARGETAAARTVRKVQDVASFVWIANLASLPAIDTTIAAARARQQQTGVRQVVGMVLYNLPDRDCSGGEALGEFDSAQGGMDRYKNEFVRPYAEKLAAASDLTFVVVVEPDAIGNIVANQAVDFCRRAAPVYEAGIAHTLSTLRSPNVNLYLDIAHGGWLGWAGNLQPTAAAIGKILRLTGSAPRLRGFSTNVSYVNQFKAEAPEPFMVDNVSWDESHYVSNIAPYLQAEGLPTRFIVDQGRVAVPGTRDAWSEWCNVSPAGFGTPAGTPVDNPLVDSIVWIKPGGESDGRCGEIPGAPVAGSWFNAYAEMLARNAHASLRG